jgi:diazepam-binding inhibitor (GABA receptor modulator, acyl-CoA-binding protein)
MHIISKRWLEIIFLMTGIDVRDAFKFNAWTQLNGMSQEEAKKQYIKLVKSILKNQLK